MNNENILSIIVNKGSIEVTAISKTFSYIREAEFVDQPANMMEIMWLFQVLQKSGVDLHEYSVTIAEV